MAGYKFDVFISYARQGDPPEWVHNHFYPRLKNALDSHLRSEPSVFIDEEMETGDSWPNRLEDALRHTKILMPVFSPQYFRSEWCLAEWHSFVAREEELGLGTSERPGGLSFPILFTDSDCFPRFARERVWWDLKKWNVPHPVFQQTVAYVDFHKEVEAIAVKLATILPVVPDWQGGWPIHRPVPAVRQHTSFPRFA